jgi:hypothetical protein
MQCSTMDEQHQEHTGHVDHWHDSACGHESTQSGGHTDYMHDGHRHHEHDGHWDEHSTSQSGEGAEQPQAGATT